MPVDDELRRQLFEEVERGIEEVRCCPREFGALQRPGRRRSGPKHSRGICGLIDGPTSITRSRRF